MHVNFTKMHGLGNDFMMINGVSQTLPALTTAQIKRWSNRQMGIGFDQLLLVEPPTQANVDFTYRIFNADGGEVEQCGNGARCFVHFVRDQGLTDKTDIAVQTLSGIIYPRLEDNNEVTVNMGVPIFAPDKIPFQVEQQAAQYQLNTDHADYPQVTISILSMGNPHAIMVVDDVDTAPVASLGMVLEQHSQFPKRCNIGFMQIIDARHIRLRVFERGSGETLACGSGACAAVVAGQCLKLLVKQSAIKVDVNGGSLSIRWDGLGQAVMMTGAASSVFEGTICL